MNLTVLGAGAWGTALAVTLVLCLGVRTLKHRTRLLNVDGR